MSIDKKVEELEKIAKSIESDRGFDITMQNFTKAAQLVKEIVAVNSKERGKITEIIKEVNGVIERELKLDCEERSE